MFPRFRRKVFCIGRNKTGTTSIKQALRQFGYKVCKASRGELLLNDWADRDYRRILRLCRRADAFRDVPFNLDGTYQAVDDAFPRSRFILTVRDSAEAWYDSLIRFHRQILRTESTPTAADLKAYDYLYPGWLWDSHAIVYGIDEATLYDRDLYMSHYETYNERVVAYFKDRPGDMVVLNVSDPSSMGRLCHFLGRPNRGLEMPHLNRSLRASAGPPDSGDSAPRDTG